MKEYVMTCVIPGRRWKIVHNLPEPAADGAVQAVYFVSLVGCLAHRETYACSCPAGRYSRPCKHARFVAGLHSTPATT